MTTTTTAMKPLPVPVPPMLEEALGYDGDAKMIAFYWDTSGDNLIYNDGRLSGTGHSWAFLAFIGHPYVGPDIMPYSFGTSGPTTHWLVLDRESRTLFADPYAEAVDLVYMQHPPLPQTDVLGLDDLVGVLAKGADGFTEWTLPTDAEIDAMIQAVQARHDALIAWLNGPEAERFAATVPRTMRVPHARVSRLVARLGATVVGAYTGVEVTTIEALLPKGQLALLRLHYDDQGWWLGEPHGPADRTKLEAVLEPLKLPYAPPSLRGAS